MCVSLSLSVCRCRWRNWYWHIYEALADTRSLKWLGQLFHEWQHWLGFWGILSQYLTSTWLIRWAYARGKNYRVINWPKLMALNVALKECFTHLWHHSRYSDQLVNIWSKQQQVYTRYEMGFIEKLWWQTGLKISEYLRSSTSYSRIFCPSNQVDFQWWVLFARFVFSIKSKPV